MIRWVAWLLDLWSTAAARRRAGAPATDRVDQVAGAPGMDAWPSSGRVVTRSVSRCRQTVVMVSSWAQPAPGICSPGTAHGDTPMLILLGGRRDLGWLSQWLSHVKPKSGCDVRECDGRYKI
jgi:hypothetical protein